MISALKTSLFVLALVCGLQLGAADPVAGSPEAEIASITRSLVELDKSLPQAESLEPFLYATSAIASQVDVFELRFGRQPQSVAGWDKLSKTAERLLKRVDGKHAGGLYIDADAAASGTCVLLELAGRRKEALRRLDHIEPGGSCGNWMASVMLAVYQQKAGIYQRAGDYEKAFAALQAARDAMGLALGAPATDLFYCRYAFLAEKNGQADTARDAYQKVVDLYPHGRGDEIARRELQRMGALIEPDLARINRLYIENPETADYDAAIYAIGAHGLPGSFDDLMGKLATAEAWQRNRIIPALGLTKDPRAIPVLRGIVRGQADMANDLHALAALGRLGDRSEVLPFLRREAAKKEGGSIDSYWLDQVLREIYGSGPGRLQAEEPLQLSTAIWAARWLNWIVTSEPEEPGAEKI